MRDLKLGLNAVQRKLRENGIKTENSETSLIKYVFPRLAWIWFFLRFR